MILTLNCLNNFFIKIKRNFIALSSAIFKIVGHKYNHILLILSSNVIEVIIILHIANLKQSFS